MESCGRFHIPALFSKDFFTSGFTLVPNLLLKYSSRLGLGSMDIAVILVLFYFQQTGMNELGFGNFAQVLSLTEKQVRKTLESLTARGFVKMSGNHLDPSGLFEKLADLWAEEKVQALQESRKESATPAYELPTRVQTPFLNKLVQAFEEEFGRPLTPMECSHIINWYKDDGYSEELILEALKRAVLRSVFNLKYIDRILSHWAKNNLRTPWEVNQYEEKYIAQRQKRKGHARQDEGKGSNKEDKYKDLYLT